MFNKEGIPFFTVIIPFLSILFVSFFATSYHLKVTNEAFEANLQEYKKLYSKTETNKETIKNII